MPKTFKANDYEVAIKSPQGEALWACLKEPKKWNPSDTGKYQITLVTSKEDAEDLINQCTAVLEKMVDFVQDDEKAVKLSPHDPWKETEDGRIEFRFKTPHFEATDKYPASKPIKTYMPDGSMVDWSATTWAVGNGSKVQIGGSIRPYYVPTLGLGVTLRLKAVKIVELEKYSSNAKDEYGFGADDETSEDSFSSGEVGQPTADF